MAKQKNIAGTPNGEGAFEPGLSSAGRTLSDKKVLMTQIAVMRYKLNYTQAHIAKRLGLSTMTVSRLLDRARDEGIVTFNINTPVSTNSQLEESLKTRYGAKEFIVVKTGIGPDVGEQMARAAAFYLDMFITAGDVLGIAGGRTLMRVMPYLRLPAIASPSQLEVVQLSGGFTNPAAHNPLSTLHEFTTQFGLKGYFLQFPIYALAPEMQQIMNSGYMQQIRNLWRRCTVCLSGVGICGPKSIFCLENELTREQMDDLVAAGAVGDIFGRWFDRRGRYINHEINRCAISVPPDILAGIPRRILVAHGEPWLEAIAAVLSTDAFNIFLTDDRTARSLMDMSR